MPQPSQKPSEPDVIDRYIEESGHTGYVTRDQMKDLGDGTYVMAKRLMFHWTLIRGLLTDTMGYDDRWCYETEAGAMKALADFPLNPPADYEPEGWHRHPPTARRRPGGDPTKEYREG